MRLEHGRYSTIPEFWEGFFFFLIWTITIYHSAQVADSDESDGGARFIHKNDRTLQYKIPMKGTKDHKAAYRRVE